MPVGRGRGCCWRFDRKHVFARHPLDPLDTPNLKAVTVLLAEYHVDHLAIRNSELIRAIPPISIRMEPSFRLQGS